MRIRFMTLLFGLFLTLSSGLRDNGLYQVITSHPHDIEELNPYVDTVYQNGRLWIVELSEDAPKELREHLVPLSGREKSYFYRGSFVSNAGSWKSNVDLKSYLSGVDAENIKKDVVELASFETRYAGTDENMEAVNNVALRFENLGFKSQKICYNSDTCSLVAERKGITDEILMVIGHIDSVGEEFAGADDNASGVAVMLEMARILQTYNNKKTIRFFISNGEELGLIGSTQYAKMLSDSKEIKKVSLVINMDMVGYNSNGIVELETDPEFEKLAKWQANLASEYTTLKTKITLGAWGSDHVPFLRKGVPSILTIEDWSTKTPCYHMECDKPDMLNYEYAAEIAKLNIASIMAKDLNL